MQVEQEDPKFKPPQGEENKVTDVSSVVRILRDVADSIEKAGELRSGYLSRGQEVLATFPEDTDSIHWLVTGRNRLEFIWRWPEGNQ
jgi:hypothetical protein